MVFTKENISDIYTLTPMQEGMYYFNKLDNLSKAYIQQSSIRFKGELDLTAVKGSLNMLVERHDVLRTVFIENLADRLLQVVLKKRDINFEYHDFTGEDNIEEKLFEFRRNIRDLPFQLNRDVLLRLAIVKTAEKCFELIWTFHHIILDGWCAAIAINEFFEIYRKRVDQQAQNLPEPVQFKKYISWLEKQNLTDSLKYWKNYLKGFEQMTSFGQKVKAECAQYQKDDHVEFIHKDLVDHLKKTAVKNQVTLYAIFQAAWGLLVARYNDTNDVVFGSVVSGRPTQIEGVDRILGLFINTMPVRIKFKEEQSFNELLKLSQNSLFQSQKHTFAPLAEIQKQTEYGGSLFDHIIAFENLPTVTNDALTDKGKSGFNIEFYLGGAEGQTNFDLDVSFIPGPDFIFQLSYNAYVYDKTAIRLLARRFIFILHQIAENENLLIKEIELLTQEEKNRIIGFNLPPVQPVKEQVVDLFRRQAELHKNKTAIYCEDRETTYAELDQISDRIAAKLVNDYGIGIEDRVGLHLLRTENLVTVMLAILKTGAAWVAIDSELPVKRLLQLAAASSLNCMVTDFADHLTDVYEKSEIISTADLIHQDENAGGFSLPDIEPESLAYILFTSGSTGEPKGVMIEHHSLIDYILSFKEYFAIAPEDKVIMQSSVTFDTMIEELFPALLSGASILMVPEGGKDIHTILSLIDHNEASVLSTTPLVISELNKYPDIVKQLRVLISGGDKLKPAHMSHLMGEVDIYNTYGPTESTVCATYHKVTSLEDAHSIGKPIVNRQVYIFDRSGHTQPVGIEGELCIGGEGVARGYLDEKQTELVFKSDPINPGKKIYYTGDRARWNEDGTIEFIDRIDNQVKIRGYRIEMQEVEKYISQFENIDDVYAVAKTLENGQKCLYAYFTSRKAISLKELRNYLIDNLPGYMVPADFMQLDSIPVLSNGKIDIKALPGFMEPEGEMKKETGPRNKPEEFLEEIWAEVLGKEKVGIFDNFFSIGGDSIKSIQIQAKLRKKGYKFELRDLFHYPTIARLADKIVRINRIPVQTSIKGTIPFTPVQRSFFEIQKTDKHHYNHAILLSYSQRFDFEGVSEVFKKLSYHHDALRIVFTKQNGKTTQINCTPERVPEIYEFDYRSQRNSEHAIREKMNALHAGFNLQEGPLIKVALFHMPDGDRLFITIHHLIIDGVSWRILLEDFEILYKQYLRKEEFDLPLKTDSYKYWAESLNNFAKSRQLMKQAAYWGEIENVIPDTIPYDFKGETCKAELLHHVSLELEPELTGKLIGEVNTVYNTQVNDILICGLGLALHDVFSLKSILLSMEGHGREQLIDDIDLSRTIGWFTSQYPIVLNISKSDDLSYTIRNVKETLHRIPMNGIGYSVLKYLSSDEQHSIKFKQKPILEFNYLGQFNSDIKGDFIENIIEQPGKLLSEQTEFDKDIIITALVPSDSLVLSIQYNKTRFKEDTVSRLLKKYMERLIEIADHCENLNEKVLTPSDLSDKDLTMDELDDIQNLVENI